MRLVLLGQFKFSVELYRCETCGFTMVGEKDIPDHLGHKFRPLFHFNSFFEEVKALWWLVRGKI